MKKFSMRPLMFMVALVLIGLFAYIRSVVPLPSDTTPASSNSLAEKSER